MLDCIVIGSGVAGISAALTLRANGKSFRLFGSPNLSEKIARAERIENYPGLSSVSGAEFVVALKKQLAGAEITVENERINGVFAMGDTVNVALQNGEILTAKTVILACGVESVKQIEGEEKFLGRGVSYCATCDGFLYKDKTIMVVSTSKTFEHEVAYLAGIAKKVWFIPLYKNAEIEAENVEKTVRMPKEIYGEKRVLGVAFEKKGEREEIAVDGVFILKESLPPSALVGGLETAEGHVVVDRQMRTNLKGIFAAGDCTGRPYQYAKATGEGNVAAHYVSAYCAKK
ncbi:MAG: FAD-dependent oxidoreductase [Clostridia bacterium]|nr:FAD-dependent oxidoreductase [Clostridia bacterium]